MLVDQWQSPQQIPSDKISSISQTPDGYLWLATKKGLFKFDGLKFQNVPFIQSKKKATRESAIPNTLFLDWDGKLWIGSHGTIILYDYKTHHFRTYSTKDGLPQDGIRRFNQDMGGDVWVSYISNYIGKFSKGKYKTYDNLDGLGDNRINGIIENKKGNLLFASANKGIYLYNGNKFLKQKIDILESLQCYTVTMYEDHEGILWLGTDIGLIKITETEQKIYSTQDGLSGNHISFILEDRKQNIWIGTTSGLNRLKKMPDNTFRFEVILDIPKIWSLFEDKEGSLWVASLGYGLSRLKTPKIKPFLPPGEYNSIEPFSLIQDEQGNILSGTSGGQILKLCENRCIQKINVPQLSNSIISAFELDVQRNLWFGTHNKGVFRLKNNKFEQFPWHSLPSDNLITAIVIDKRGDLWFGTFDGVNVLRRFSNTIESLNTGNGLKGHRIHYIYEEKSSNICIATNNGVTFLRNGSMESQNIKTYLQGIPVTCILEDSPTLDNNNGVYWITTLGSGLVRFTKEGNSVTRYTIDDGMISNSLTRIFEDKQDNFWILSGNGILKVNKSEFHRFDKGRIDRINCISYGVSDGLKNGEFTTPFSQHSAIKTRAGEIIFLDKKEIFVLSPENIGINKIPPTVIIEKAFFDQHSVSLPIGDISDNLRGVKNIRFRITATTLISSKKVIFKYRLKGVQSEWKYLSSGNERIIRYSNLKPGNFTFQITACNADGVWNNEITSLQFKLSPSLPSPLIIIIPLLVISLTITTLWTIRIHRMHKNAKRALEEEQKKEEERKKLEEKKKEVERIKQEKVALARNSINLSPYFVEECVKKLIHQMEVEKIYRDENLSLPGLADIISIQRHQLSEILNKRIRQKFTDFVNYYRTLEAKELLANPKETSKKIQTIAIDVGFNTMAAFHKAFKKNTGMTPGQYKKKVQIKENL